MITCSLTSHFVRNAGVFVGSPKCFLCVQSSTALLDQIALVVAKPWIFIWAPRVASGRWCASVTFANLFLVVGIFLAPVHQEEGGLDAGPADFDFRCRGIFNKLPCKRVACVQSSLASSISKHRLILNVHFLVDVQTALCNTDLAGCQQKVSGEEENQELQ